MKAIKYSTFIASQKPPLEHRASTSSAARWGVFLASFLGTLLVVGAFNSISLSGSGDYTVTAQEEEQVKAMYSDLQSFMQFMSMVRNNVAHDRPLFSYFPVYPLLNPKDIHGLSLPVANTFIPLNDPGYLPNSIRAYRNGTHQGFDIPASTGIKVYSLYYGEVIRIDHDFVALTPEEYQAMISQSMQQDTTPEYILDKIRGRQVWVNHGNGVISRYCHLSAVHDGLKKGDYIEKGQFLGNVGRSGLEQTSFGNHLHFEIWVNNSFLGDGLSYEQIKKTIQRAFSS